MYRTAASAFIHILRLDESVGRKGAGVERIKTKKDEEGQISHSKCRRNNIAEKRS